MADYEMQESNLPNEEGKRILYPSIRLTGQDTLDDVAKYISLTSTFSPGDIKGAVQALVEAIAHSMGEGRSVKIDGLGIFTPTLGLREGFERESGEPDEQRRNAMSICISGVRFKPDKTLLRETAGQCTLERTSWKFRKSSQRYTPQERLKLAQDYLAEHSFMTVADYERLTGLLHTAAAFELRMWRETDGSGISCHGRGSHRVYVARQDSPTEETGKE